MATRNRKTKKPRPPMSDEKLLELAGREARNHQQDLARGWLHGPPKGWQYGPYKWWLDGPPKPRRQPETNPEKS